MFNTELISLENLTNPHLYVAQFFMQYSLFYNDYVYRQVLMTVYARL